jgi:hypothetical protein
MKTSQDNPPETLSTTQTMSPTKHKPPTTVMATQSPHKDNTTRQMTASAWTTVSANSKPGKAPIKCFKFPIAQRVKALSQVKIPGCKTPHNTYFDITLNLPEHPKPQNKFLSILNDMWKNLKELNDETTYWHPYRATC